MRKPKIKLVSIVAALVALISAPSVAHASHDRGGQEMVTFGDSFTANGGASGDRAAVSPYLAPIPRCANDKHNWAHQTAHMLGHSLADYSCNGTSYNLAPFVTHAVLSGNIGPNTKEVAFMYGGLQPGAGIDTLAGMALPDGPRASTYRGLLAAQFEKIRAVAPNARITMVNYTPMTVDDTLCVVNEDFLKLPVTIPGVTAAEEAFNAEILRAANALGVNSIDLHMQAKTHDTCQPNPAERWAAAINTPSAPAALPMHPTDAGHTGMAQIITRELQS